MITIYTILLQLFLASCAGPFKCEKGNGDVISKKLDLEQFESFSISCSADVELTQGDVQSVELVGESNILELFNTKVSGGNWDIDTKDCFQTKKGLKVKITMTELRNISINGSGNIRGVGIFKTKDLSIDVNGSGDADLELEAEDVSMDVNGSGDLNLSGKCDDLNISVNGSGDIKATGLDADDCDVSVNGSGDSNIKVSGHLTASVNGSGDINYQGSPKSVEVQDNGSGDVNGSK